MTGLHLLFGALAGLWATSVMDRTALVMIRRKMVRLEGLQIVPLLLGRWILIGLRSRRFLHDDIRTQPPQSGELVTGLVAHYLIGIVLGLGFVVPLSWVAIETAPLFVWGVVYGFLTNAFPWLMMYPAMGFGVAGSRLPQQKEILKFSGVNHVAYGLALALLCFFLRRFQ